MNRELSPKEKALIYWMLNHGEPKAQAFLPQLERAQVTPERCACGCASVNFSIEGLPKPSGGMNVLADFIFGSDDDLNGAFVFEQGGTLSGMEVYGLTGDAPKELPTIEDLRPIGST